MSNRPRGSLVSAAIAGIAGALGIGAQMFGSLGNFFANAALAPDRWTSRWSQGTTQKRLRRGSIKRSNPAGSAARNRKGELSRRPRFLTEAPSWTDPNRLMARGNRVWLTPDGPKFELPANSGRELDAMSGVGAYLDTPARPHLSKAEAIGKYRISHGNARGRGKILRVALRSAEAKARTARGRDQLIALATAATARKRLNALNLPA